MSEPCEICGPECFYPEQHKPENIHVRMAQRGDGKQQEARTPECGKSFETLCNLPRGHKGMCTFECHQPSHASGEPQQPGESAPEKQVTEADNKLAARISSLFDQGHPIPVLVADIARWVAQHRLESALSSEAGGEPQPDVESLAAKFHEIYQVEARRQGDVRHKDAYADLPENIKEFDRVLARYVIELLSAGIRGRADLSEGWFYAASEEHSKWWDGHIGKDEKWFAGRDVMQSEEAFQAGWKAAHPLTQEGERKQHVGWIAGHCSDPMNCPKCRREWGAKA